MFQRCHTRRKDGKLHRYWSIVETRRVAGGRVVQRPVLYLGEINDSQREAWRKTIEVLEEGVPQPRTLALFPADRRPPVADDAVVQIRLQELTVRRPRQWGACWLACHLWTTLGLDGFWAARLEPSRKGTRWDLILTALTAYRLIDPGSEWRFHREWDRAERPARPARGRGRVGGHPHALPLPGPPAPAQARPLRTLDRSVAGPVQRPLRDPAL